MATMNLTSTSVSGFLEADYNQIKDAFQDGGVEIDFSNVTWIVDEDDMTSDSAVLLPTQQSVKAYADTKAAKDAAFNNKSADYTLVASDNNKIIEVDTTATITLPDGLDTGFQAIIINTGSSQTITLSATTTLTSKDSNTTITSQYGAVTVYHAGSNVWRAFGDLS